MPSRVGFLLLNYISCLPALRNDLDTICAGVRNEESYDQMPSERLSWYSEQVEDEIY